jgi:SAM-dependent methyltransferase
MSLARRIRFQWKYFRNPPWDTGTSPPELVDFIANHPPGRALDLGSGTGTNAITLARSGWQVTGIDFAWRAIKIARRKTKEAGVIVDLRVGNILQLNDLAGVFDLILDIGCYHSLPAGGKRIYENNLEIFLAPQGYYLMYGFLQSPDDSGPGMSMEDVERLSARLRLVKRVDSLGRGMRPSVWLTYQGVQAEGGSGLSHGTAAGNRRS